MLAKLRAETRRPDIEDLEHAAREEERLIDYRLALHAERQDTLAKLRYARSLPPDERAPTSPLVAYEHRPTGAAWVAHLERTIIDIDAELARLEAKEES